MKKEQLLQFVPKEDEKYMTTHKISLIAKQHDYVILALLTELANLPRPLVKKVEFGKKRMHRLWKQTKIEKEQVEVLLKIKPEERETKDHLTICQHRYWGLWSNYINDVIEQIKSEIVHTDTINKLE